jgi:hypothetical protein
MRRRSDRMACSVTCRSDAARETGEEPVLARRDPIESVKAWVSGAFCPSDVGMTSDRRDATQNHGAGPDVPGLPKGAKRN